MCVYPLIRTHHAAPIGSLSLVGLSVGLSASQRCQQSAAHTFLSSLSSSAFHPRPPPPPSSSITLSAFVTLTIIHLHPPVQLRVSIPPVPPYIHIQNACPFFIHSTSSSSPRSFYTRHCLLVATASPVHQHDQHLKLANLEHSPKHSHLHRSIKRSHRHCPRHRPNQSRNQLSPLSCTHQGFISSKDIGHPRPLEASYSTHHYRCTCQSSSLLR